MARTGGTAPPSESDFLFVASQAEAQHFVCDKPHSRNLSRLDSFAPIMDAVTCCCTYCVTLALRHEFASRVCRV